MAIGYRRGARRPDAAKAATMKATGSTTYSSRANVASSDSTRNATCPSDVGDSSTTIASHIAVRVRVKASASAVRYVANAKSGSTSRNAAETSACQRSSPSRRARRYKGTAASDMMMACSA